MVNSFLLQKAWSRSEILEFCTMTLGLGVLTETPHSALICCRSLVNHWVFLTYNPNCRAACATVWTYCRVLSCSGSCSKFATFWVLQQMSQGSISKCGISCLQNPKMFTKHGPSFLVVESTRAINFPDLGGDVLPCPPSLDPWNPQWCDRLRNL